MSWLRRTSRVGIASLLLVGCGTLLEDQQLGDSTGSGGSSGTTLGTTSVSLDSGSTTQTTGDIGTTSGSSTSGSTDGSSSGDTTGLPIECGDTRPVTGEYCHEQGPTVQLSIDVCDIEIAQIDGSSHADLVLSVCLMPVVYNLIGSVSGLMVPPGTLTAMVGNTAITDFALGNFWGDDRAEMVALTPSGAMLTFHTTGTLFDTLNTIAFSDPITQIEVGRLGDDEWSDVVAVDPVAMNGDTSWQVEQFDGVGMVGMLGAPIEYDPAILEFEARLSDLDGDQQPELLLAHYGDMSRRVVAYRGDSGGFMTAGFSSTQISGLKAYAVGDLDTDGDRDLVATVDGVDGVFVYQQGPNLGFSQVGTRNLALPNPQTLALVDLDHDGRDDLITIHGEQLLVSRSLERLDFEMVDTIMLPESGEHLRVGDVNGDDVPDVVVVTVPAANGETSVVQLLSDP